SSARIGHRACIYTARQCNRVCRVRLRTVSLPWLCGALAHPPTVSIPKLCVGQSFCVGAALCVRPPPGNHIGLPLRLHQRFRAMSSRKYEFFCFLPLCTDLT